MWAGRDVWDRRFDWLIRHGQWFLIVAALLTVLAWAPAQRLAFDQSIESLYAASNPRLVDFVESKEIFGGDEFVVLAYRDPELFDADGDLSDAARDRLDDLQTQLAELPGVIPESIQTLADALRSPYGRSRIREFATGLLLGADGETTAVVCRLMPIERSPVPRHTTFRLVRKLADAQPLPTVVVGEPIQVHDMFRYVEEDGRTLGWWSVGILMLVILVLFRSLRWMVLPLAIVQCTLVWTKAVLVLSQMQLSMVSSMLNSLAMIIGIATTMHLTLRFRDLRAHLDREQALSQAVRDLAAPVFWTVLTTAAGFAALISSRIAPSASFGVMMALTTLLILVACALILPGGVLAGRRTSIPAVPTGEPWVVARLTNIAAQVERRPFLVCTAMTVVAVVCTWGLFRLEIETDFSKNFRAGSPIVRALSFFEDHLGGAGTWEINFPAPDVLTEEYLDELRLLAEDLRELETRTTSDRLTKVVVLTDGLDLIPANLLFRRLSVSTRLNLMNAVQPEFVESLYNPAAGRMRIMLRALERQPSQSKLKLIADVEAIGRKHFPEAKATGLFVLLAFLIESLMEDQVVTSVLAAAAIVVLMSLAQRSLSLGIALLIPNLFPIVLVIGTMGWIGMKVNIASAMIASVSMGLTIDSSIHYLAGYRRHRAAGLSQSDALRATHRETGLALVWSNLALVAGFSVLTLSHFIPLIYFGVLVSVAMIGGLLGNLTLLPVLIRLFDHRTYPAPSLQAPSSSSPVMPTGLDDAQQP